jgi:CRISPR/Cas system-associated exonuclease Cas4 (RecB family)
MTDVAVTEALGESLSPSQVSTYMTCPAKWHFRYLIGLSEPTTGALALGKAFHGTLARNFRQKWSTGRDMETQERRQRAQRQPALHSVISSFVTILAHFWAIRFGFLLSRPGC